MRSKFTLAAGLAALTLGAAWMPASAHPDCCSRRGPGPNPGGASPAAVGGRSGGGGGGATSGATGGESATGATKPRATVPTAGARGIASRELLELRWNYPMHASGAAAVPANGTDVEARRESPSREKVLETLASDDPRPLLVLRECAVCNKTDDALLSREGSNERTLVLARFFRCVKLPVDVVKPDHAFNALFPTNEAEHLFVSARDGSAKRPLESDTSRTELWSAMESTLLTAYGIDATKVTRQVLAGLDRVDECERRFTALETRKGQLMETPSVDLAKVKSVDAELEVAGQSLAEARSAVAKLFQIEPKVPAPGVAR